MPQGRKRESSTKDKGRKDNKKQGKVETTNETRNKKGTKKETYINLRG